jgi:hypothetical protein
VTIIEITTKPKTGKRTHTIHNEVITRTRPCLLAMLWRSERRPSLQFEREPTAATEEDPVVMNLRIRNPNV